MLKNFIVVLLLTLIFAGCEDTSSTPHQQIIININNNHKCFCNLDCETATETASTQDEMFMTLETCQKEYELEQEKALFNSMSQYNKI